MGDDGGMLDAVEVAADLFGGVDAVVEVRDEAGDGPLEVDVVFPKSVVGIDQQGLVDRMTEGMISGVIEGGHRLIIKAVPGPGVTKVWRVCPGWGMFRGICVCEIGSNEKVRCCTTGWTYGETGDPRSKSFGRCWLPSLESVRGRAGN